MTDTSAALSLPYIQPSQAQKHVTHNEAVRILDAVTQLSVLSSDLTAAPMSNAVGDRFLVASGAVGEWAGKDGQIAVFDGTGWAYFRATAGWRADVIPTGAQLRFDGAGWVPALPDLQNIPQLGVATTADDVNRLSVASPATLFSHDGAGHQLKINKSAGTDTASLLFQSNWSGRAEMGLAGTDDFSIRVSDDGSSFRDAVSVSATDGAVRIPSGQTYLVDISIADDAAYAFDIPWSDPSRLLIWLGVDLVAHSFLFSVTGALAGAGNFTPLFTTPAGKLDFATGPLSGTSGPDDTITVSIDISTGTPRMYLENRLGTAQQFTLATLGR